MDHTAERKLAAAHEFYAAIVERLTGEKGVHAETAIAGAARMAGTFLLRSFNFPVENLQPGDVVLSDAANEEGPLLVNLLGGTLQQLNVTLDEVRLASAQGQGDKPQLGVIETQALLESALSEIKDRHQLTFREAALAGAIAAALMVQKFKDVVDPHVGFYVAAYGFVEGAKTVPRRLGPPAAGEGKRPWYKFW
jgi:hypothetical protein